MSLAADVAAEPKEFKIGLIAEPGERPCTGGGPDAQGCNYVRWILANSILAPGLTVKIVAGNHWEVTDWLRRREIDAAVVSAVSDYSLRRISGIKAVAELPAEKADGTTFDADGVVPGYVLGDKAPSGGLDRLFSEIDECEQDCGQKPAIFEAPSQLSSTRFVFPLLVAQHWFDRTHSCRGDDRGCQQLIEQRAKFWTKLLGRIKFRTPIESPKDKCAIDSERITFTSVHVDPRGCDLKRIQEYLPKNTFDHPFPARRTPFDRLLVWSDRAIDTGLKFLPDASERFPLASDGGYSRIIDPAAYEDVRKAFELMLEGLRKEPGLDYRMANWYDEGVFTFTVDDLIAELRRQQNRDGRPLALTLSGGGVKSVFQSVVLDYLYQNGRLFNAKQRTATDPTESVAVSPIIGTSGGALNGLLTWLIYDSPRDFVKYETIVRGQHDFRNDLTSNWVSPGPNGVATSNITEADIFPYLNVLRYLSFLVSFSIILIILRVTAPAGNPNRGQTSAVSKMALTVTLAIVLAVPVLVWMRPSPSLYPDNGLAYVALLVSAYFCLVLLLKNQEEHKSTKLSALGILLDVVLIAGITYLFYLASVPLVCKLASGNVCDAAESPGYKMIDWECSLGAALYVFVVVKWLLTSVKADGENWQSAMMVRLLLVGIALAICGGLAVRMVDPIVCAGLLLIWSLLIAAYCDRSLPTSRTRFGGWSPQVVLVCVVVTGTFLTAVLVKLATFTGQVTQFEFSVEYWLAVGCAAVITGLVLHAAIWSLRDARKGWRYYLYQNYSNLDRELSFTSHDWGARPASVFLSLMLLGWALWTALPVQSLYGGDVAFDKVRQAVVNVGTTKGSCKRADLVLVGSVLGNSQAAHVEPQALSSICPIHDQVLVTAGPEGCQLAEAQTIDGEKLLLQGALSAPDNQDINACGEPHENGQHVILSTIDRLICAATASGSPFPIFPPTPKSLPSGQGCNDQINLVDGGYSANQPKSVARQLNASMILSIEATPECRSQEKVGSMFSTLGILLGYLWDRSQLPDHSATTGALVASILPPNDKQRCSNRAFLMDFRGVTVLRLFSDAEQLLSENADIGVIRAWPAPALVAVRMQ